MNNLNNGLSGCKLEFINNKVIRKYSSSLDYNTRLVKQIDKQILFSNFILKNISTPKIFNINKNDLYSFEMEYIPGFSSYDYFSICSPKDVDFVLDTLFSYFDFLILNSKQCKVNLKILEKIDFLEKNTTHKKYLKCIKKEVIKKDIIVPKTFCHGDLTFSNILFHKNRIFFIDFLDSYIDSFICDLVKLKQDLYYLWNMRINKMYSQRIHQIYSYIWNSLSERYYSHIDTIEFKVVDVMNSLRIEPYLTNQYQRDILTDIIKDSDLYEKFDRTNGRKIF